MATVKRFEELNAWQVARVLCKRIGAIIDKEAFKKNYRLIAQIEGSSGSIMDNIAEGFERGSKGEFILFLGYSKGSCGELRSQLYRALDRNYISQEIFDELTSSSKRISAMIQKLIEYLTISNLNGIRKKQPLNP